ncbi:hypothetical protein Goklo_012497 [Gossypium klotzschianum]|uniref:Uncharacterized protein n=1 Tax=Gossypium klotzschianum TaxID=34286 RepID=A0A7J8VCE2_9ROSI|nr:hypothetical protein [Gossypium klotzschianum]
MESGNTMLIDTICNGLATISRAAEVKQIYDWCSKNLGSQISTYLAECQ